MFTRRFTFLATLAFAGSTLAASAPAAAQDRSVAERLEAAGLEYRVDEDGDYAVVLNYRSEGRTQLAYVSGLTETIDGVVIRQIFSPAAGVERDGIDGDKALELLQASGRTKMGAWEIRGEVLFFVIKVVDDMNAQELKTLINTAASTADDLEIELTGGKDDL